MKNQIQLVSGGPFDHIKFGRIYAFTDEEGTEWFLGKEVAQVLGYAIPQKAITDHVSKEHRKVLKYKSFSNSELASILWPDGNYSNKTIISEPGVYELIFGSTLPEAKAFKHWVCAEVLPSIRKYGYYDMRDHYQPRSRYDDLMQQFQQCLDENQRMLDSIRREQQILPTHYANY